jgi:hypothetical protein
LPYWSVTKRSKHWGSDAPLSASVCLLWW